MISCTTTLILVAFATIFAAATSGKCDTVEITIERAVSEYQTAMQSTDRQQRLYGFRRSQLLFQKAIDDLGNDTSAPLYTNLGNAALAGERLGPAIVAYRRALLIDSSYDRARDNLEHARSLLPQWVQQKRQSSIFADFVRSLRSYDGLSRLAAACFATACILYGIGHRWKVGVVKWISALPFCIWVALLVANSGAFSSMSLQAVVIRDDVTARSADSHHSPARLSRNLPSGTEVAVVDRREGWLQVSISNETVWIPVGAAELISLNNSG